MILQKSVTYFDKIESKRKLSTWGVMIPSKSIGEIKEIFSESGGVIDEKLNKLDSSILLDRHCVEIVSACKNGGISQADREMNKTLCYVLRHIIDEQKKRLNDENKNDDEKVFNSLIAYKRAVEVICFSSRRIIPHKRTEIKQLKIEEAKKEIAFLKTVGALSK